MRLSAIYKQYTFLSLILILLIGGIIHYVIFQQTIHYTANESLREYQKTLLKFVGQHDSLMTAGELGVKEGRLLFIPTQSPEDDTFFQDTLIQDSRNGKYRNFRIINFPVEAKGESYRALIFLRTMGDGDLVRATALSFICLFLLFTLFVFLISHFFTRKIWIPFSVFLEELKLVDLNRGSRLNFSPTKIDEINELDDAYSRMMNRIRNDYQNMKELSENITHELQTPLTIMRSKIDLLLQNTRNDEEMITTLQSLQASINRISRFNRSLMLLTRIDNNVYVEKEALDMGALIGQKIDDYNEILAMRAIQTNLKIHSPFLHNMNEVLAEVLINNVLSNAIKYNPVSEGFLNVEIDSNSIVLENRFEEELPAGDLFTRFNKNKRYADSNGLGLSIVKAVCEKSQLQVAIEVELPVFRLRIFK